MTYGDIPPSVEVDPDTRSRNNPCARARTKVLALLFERREALIFMRKAPLGMLVNYTLITPRDDCPIQKVMCLPDGQIMLSLTDPERNRGASAGYVLFAPWVRKERLHALYLWWNASFLVPGVEQNHFGLVLTTSELDASNFLFRQRESLLSPNLWLL